MSKSKIANKKTSDARQPALHKANVSCRFQIDFFEFSFLVEACIPPRPIARAMFWDDVINKYYQVLTPDERAKLYEWIVRNPCFDLANEDCALFAARFNPANQYKLQVSYGDSPEIDAFKWKDGYYVGKNVSVNPDYIINAVANGS